LIALTHIAERLRGWPNAFLMLAMRVWIARVFFLSGLVKIGDWDATIFLFQTEYRLPLLPPQLAATISAACELGMPVLLVLGLFSRLAALPLIGMTLVIHFVLGAANPVYRSLDHVYWLFLLAAIVVQGAGRLSLDALIWPRLTRIR
jgi:putative oxidoreductase